MTPILNIVIISVILAGITIHRYLSTFQEQDMLPYPWWSHLHQESCQNYQNLLKESLEEEYNQDSDTQ